MAVDTDGCQSGLLSLFAKEMSFIKTTTGSNPVPSSTSVLIYCRERFVMPCMPYCILRYLEFAVKDRTLVYCFSSEEERICFCFINSKHGKLAESGLMHRS